MPRLTVYPIADGLSSVSLDKTNRTLWEEANTLVIYEGELYTGIYYTVLAGETKKGKGIRIDWNIFGKVFSVASIFYSAGAYVRLIEDLAQLPTMTTAILTGSINYTNVTREFTDRVLADLMLGTELLRLLAAVITIFKQEKFDNLRAYYKTKKESAMTVEDMKFDRRITDLFIKNVKATQNSTVHIESVRLIERVIDAFNPAIFTDTYYSKFVNPEGIVLECDELYRLFDVICSPEKYISEDHGEIMDFLSKVIILADNTVPNIVEIAIRTNKSDIVVKSGEFNKKVIEYILEEINDLVVSSKRNKFVRPILELIVILRYVPIEFMLKNLSRRLVDVYHLLNHRGRRDIPIGNVSISICIEILNDILMHNRYNLDELIDALEETDDEVNLVLKQIGITHHINIDSVSRLRNRDHDRNSIGGPVDERDLRHVVPRYRREFERNSRLENRRDEYKIARMLLDHVNKTVSTTEITRGKTSIKDMDIRDVIAGSQHEEEFVEFTVRIKLK